MNSKFIDSMEQHTGVHPTMYIYTFWFLAFSVYNIQYLFNGLSIFVYVVILICIVVFEFAKTLINVRLFGMIWVVNPGVQEININW